MTNTFRTIAWWLTLLTGLTLVFIGARFFIAPDLAETAFGINVNTGGDYSFHYIKAGRDLFSGIIIIVLLLMKEYRALGMLLLLAPIVPTVDMSIVMSQPHYKIAFIYPHLTAIILGIVLGIAYLWNAKTIGRRSSEQWMHKD